MKYQNNTGKSHQLIHLDPDPVTLEDLGTLCVFHENQELNTPGEVPDCCYYVKSGRITCCEMSDTGDYVYNYFDPGTLILEEYILSGRPAPVVFRALINSELIRIESEDFLYAYRHSFSIATEVCESLADKLTNTVDHFIMNNKSNSSWKICHMLIFFAQNYGQLTDEGLIKINYSLSHQKLADMLGINRVTVTKKLKELKDLGLIEVQARKIYLPNVDNMVDYMVSIQEGDEHV